MKKIVYLLLFFLLLSPFFVQAQLTTEGGFKNSLGNLQKVGGAGGEKLGVSADLPGTIAMVIKIILSLVGTIFLLLTVYAGILWMTARGESSQVEKAQEIIKTSIIGLIVVLSAYAITVFVMSRLTSSTGVASGSDLVNCSSYVNASDCGTPVDTNGQDLCQWNTDKCENK